jgi:hypothetical protein
VDQLFLFNLIDGTPAVETFEVAPVVPRPKPAPPAPKPAAYEPKVMDMVVILPFTDQSGNERGKFLKTPSVVVGFNPVGMALLDVGTPGNLYAAEAWRLVKMDD